MRILIAGASPTGRQLLASLTRDSAHEIALVDRDAEVCEQLAAEHDALVVNGDATDPEILDKAQIDRADAVVACTSSDPINTVIAMLAHRQGVERIIVVITTDTMRGALGEVGVTDVIAPTMAAVGQIEAALQGADSTQLGELMQRGLHLAEMHVGEDADRSRLGDHDLPDGALAIAHVRGDELQLARPDIELRAGDVVLALAESEKAARAAHTALR